MANKHFIGENADITVEFEDSSYLPVVLDSPPVVAIRLPDGTTVTSPAVGSGSTWTATYELEQAGYHAYRFVGERGSPQFKGVIEGQFYVEDSIVTPELTFLTEGDDFEAVRNVMGLTKWDVDDDMIRAYEFGWQAEYRVKQAFPGWEDAPPPRTLLKLASVYCISALIAESYAKGGTIGNTEGGDARKDRDWPKFASLMWARFNDLIAMSSEDVVSIYDLDGFTIAHRGRAFGRDWSTAYPPIYDTDISPQTS